MDSLRILSDKRIIWLNPTFNGNESAAHVRSDPLILRLYGSARVIQQADAEWNTLIAHFFPLLGTRKIFDLTIDLVQASCGMGVPYADFAGDRLLLNDWVEKKGHAGILQYWVDKNQLSIDNIPTNIVEKNIKS